MAIQNRRGVYSDFTPSKMVPGELAVVQSGDPNNTSGKAVYAAFGSSGDVKRLASEDDLSKKVDKETGKVLSTNDYTDTEKTKLAGIASGAEVNVQSDWSQSNTSADDFIKNKPTKTSDFTNDGDGTSNFATESYVQLNGGKIDTISVNGTQQTITNKNVDIPVPVIDNTLTQSGKAADAKVTGDELASVKSDLSNVETTIDVIAKTQTEVTDYQLELINPDSETLIKTNNITGKTSIKLGISQGNVLCLPYFRQSGYKQNGLTFTINNDGSITVNGTASADTTYNIAYYTDPVVQFSRVHPTWGRQYGFWLSGCVDGSDSTYYIRDAQNGHICRTSPVEIFNTNPIATVNITLVIKSGVTLTDKTFYPMLSKTNQEEFTSPIPQSRQYSATIASTDAEYTWNNLQFNEGYNLVVNSGANTLTVITAKYDTFDEVYDEIDEINEKLWVNPWKDKKWVAFGTSITDNYSQASYITQGDHAGEHTGKYVPYLLDMSELSSSAFVNRGVAGGSINGHILYYIRYYTSDQLNADLITIEGAVNDFAVGVPLGQVGDTVPYTNNLLPDSTSEGTFAGACYQAFTTALENAPNAIVVLLTETTGKNHVGYANYSQTRKNDLGLYQSDYIEMTMKVAEFVGIPVINCGRNSMINAQNPQYIADHIHHTYLGGYQYASVIWEKLKQIPLKKLTVPT